MSKTRHDIAERGFSIHKTGALTACCITRALCLILLLTAAAGSLRAQGADYHPHAAIRSAVIKFLNDYAKKKHKGEFKVIAGRLDPRLFVHRCSLPLDVSVNQVSRYSGHLTVRVSCHGQASWKIYVPSRIVYYQQVLAVRRTLARGTPIQPRDLYKVRHVLNNLSYGYYTDPKQVAGKIASRYILSNSVLTPHMLSDPILVQRGQSVVLEAEIGGVTVRMTGKALASGSIGKLIKVRNLSSRRIVEGIVTRQGTVRVN